MRSKARFSDFCDVSFIEASGERAWIKRRLRTRRGVMWRSSSLINILLLIDDLSNMSAEYKQRGEPGLAKYSGA